MTDQDAPRVGSVVDPPDTSGICAYSWRPGAPRCTEVATTHVLLSTMALGEVCLATCDKHLRIAHAVGLFLLQHRFTDDCRMIGIGTVWDRESNACVVAVIEC